MKLITTIVRPERLPEVKAALFRAGVTGISLSRVSGHGGEQEIVEQYRGTTVVMEFHEKVRIEMACSEPFVEPTIQAFLYGGLVRPKNALNTMMMSIVALGVVGVQWVLVGYSLAFGHGGPLLGGLGWLGFRGVGAEPDPAYAATIPLQAHAMFQGMFAIITPALIAGAVVERMRFRAYVAFIVLWATLVYDPLAHWVWGAGGWLQTRGALDFAGGTVVHVSAGVSAFVAARALGARRDFKRTAIVPHNVPLVLLGAGLLWFGWFGFNAGSALAANGVAALAFTNTNTAAATALVTWACCDLARTGKITAVGAATSVGVRPGGASRSWAYRLSPCSPRWRSPPSGPR